MEIPKTVAALDSLSSTEVQAILDNAHAMQAALRECRDALSLLDRTALEQSALDKAKAALA